MYQDHEDNPGTLDVTIQFERVSDREVRAWAILDMTAKVRLDLPFDLPREMPPSYSLRIEPEDDVRDQAEQFKQFLHHTLRASLQMAIEEVLGVQVDLEEPSRPDPDSELDPDLARLDLAPLPQLESYPAEVRGEGTSEEPVWYEDDPYEEESES